MKILDNTELSIRRELHLLFLIMIDTLLPCNFVFWPIYLNLSLAKILLIVVVASSK